METSTSKITEALYQKVRDNFINTAISLRNLGVSDETIQNNFDKYLEEKRIEFYRQSGGPKLLSTILPEAFREARISLGDKIIKKDEADSKAEVVFYELLRDHGIPFDFQVKIGSYRVDFLINKSLIFEGDGPHHDHQVEYDNRRDNYLKKLGYKVMRCKWDLVFMMQDEIIDIIKRFDSTENK